MPQTIKVAGARVDRAPLITPIAQRGVGDAGFRGDLAYSTTGLGPQPGDQLMYSRFHAAEHAPKRASVQAPTAIPLRFAAHFPTNGRCGYLRRVENEQQTVGKNLAQLIDAAGKKLISGPSSKKGLADAINKDEPPGKDGRDAINRRTIQRAIDGAVPVQVDTLGKIARAYGLEAWQLLVPDWAPGRPPVLLTPAREALATIWKASHEILEARKHGSSRPGTGVRAGSPPAGANPGSKPRRKRQKN
ncbi:MAG: hypothetical protein KGI71_06270 [Patescibacteria group bacterium]|nr:hypothetical protein [Patescibacteria group bacterium]